MSDQQSKNAPNQVRFQNPLTEERQPQFWRDSAGYMWPVKYEAAAALSKARGEVK